MTEWYLPSPSLARPPHMIGCLFSVHLEARRTSSPSWRVLHVKPKKRSAKRISCIWFAHTVSHGCEGVSKLLSKNLVSPPALSGNRHLQHIMMQGQPKFAPESQALLVIH